MMMMDYRPLDLVYKIYHLMIVMDYNHPLDLVYKIYYYYLLFLFLLMMMMKMIMMDILQFELIG